MTYKTSTKTTAAVLAIALGTAFTAVSAPAFAGDKKGMGAMEKCYGINAAFKNDCQSPGHSCAGQDAKAADPAAFVVVPKGLCEKINGGSTSPAKS